MDDWYTEANPAQPQQQQQQQPGLRPAAHQQQQGFANAADIGGGGYAAAAGSRMYGDSFTPPASGNMMGMMQQQPGAGGSSMYGYAGSGGFVAGTGGGSTGFSGAIGGAFNPQTAAGSSMSDVYANEPPLLEELGINFEHIWAKTRTVMNPTRRIDISYLDDTDLAGPLVFALIFGFCLLFTGKVHFGYIYGFGLFGCLALALVLNLLGDKPIDTWKTCSVLGYCLLPVVALSAVGIALDLRGTAGLALAAGAVCWSCTAATKLFEEYLGMRKQRWLIAYPIGLLYCAFVLMTIF